MTEAKRNRPGRATEATPNQTFTLSLAELDDYARHVDGCFLVCVELPGERYRRRAYLTVASAQRAVRNAQSRGHNARIYLAEARPLFHVTGGES